MSIILALDLGSSTGYAYGNDFNTLTYGSQTWATDKELRAQRKLGEDRTQDIRILRFFHWLTDLDKEYHFETVVFEDILFSNSRAQTQLWSSFRAVMWLSFPGRKLIAVPVQTLKKYATGCGNAKKPDMALALAGIPDFISTWQNLNDDTVDAIHLWRYANEKSR